MSVWAAFTAVIATIQVLHLVKGGAILEVRMVSYSNPDGTDWNDNYCDSSVLGKRWKCDLKFTFCFDKSTGSWEPEICSYKKVESGEYQNQHDVTFGSRISTADNPIKLTFGWWPGAVRFKARILDDDSFNHDDLVDLMHSLWTLTPQRSLGQAVWSRRRIMGTRQHNPTSLMLNLRLYCEHNYYNTRCDQYCKSSNGPRQYYTCDPATGGKVCWPGWESNDCDVISDDCIANSCTNGATCQDGHRQYTCKCHVGYTGRFCETDIDDCAAAPCFHGGRCVDEVGSYTCVCPLQYVGSNCEHHVCDKDTSPCLNGGTCYVDDNEARCHCLPAFTGDVCDVDRCLDVRCLNQGTCNNGICICRPGWEGTHCDVVSDDCLTNKCTNGATCLDGHRQYSCNCVGGFTGKYCETDMDDCFSAPCLNGGRCVDQVAGYRCVCPPEYVGDRCSQHVCDGDQSPCLNGGTCYVDRHLPLCLCPAAFSGDVCQTNRCFGVTCENSGTCENGICICQPGWEGTRCDVNSDDCIDNACTNGATCRDGRRQYTCSCVLGFEGKYCETNIDDCAPVPCLNGGRCVDEVDDYKCVCHPEYVGVNCSHHVCDEDTSPCLNGGSCHVVDNEARCLCPLAFSGDVCERDNCLDVTCLNDGTCENGICICQQGWEGKNCDVISDDCIDNSCTNGATCRDGRGQYTCECPLGFTGTYCETDVNECASTPCLNGGRCFDDVAAYRCVCQPEYVGVHCSHHVCDSTQSRCQHGGICYVSDGRARCLCTAEFSGDLCERDKCLDVTCLNEGKCEKGTCVCGRGFVGDRCSHHVCDTENSPCLNGGTCYVLGGKARCICPKAFAGDVCERDKCLDMTCLNQGACENGTCVCRPGFIGVFCALDLCKLTPCMNGASCEAGVCSCAPGYSGDHCHTETNECESDPCQHDGTCRDHVNVYTCDCLPAYNGTHCEHVVPTSPPVTLDHVIPTSRQLRRGQVISRVTWSTGDVTTPSEAAVRSQSVAIPLWTVGVVVGLVNLFIVVVVVVLLVLRRRSKRKASTASVDSTVAFRCGQGAGGAAAACADHQHDVIPALTWHRCVMNHLHSHTDVRPPPYTATTGRLVAGVQGYPVNRCTGVGRTSLTDIHFENPAFDISPTDVTAVAASTDNLYELPIKTALSHTDGVELQQ